MTRDGGDEKEGCSARCMREKRNAGDAQEIVSPKDGSRSLAPGDGFFLRFGNV